MKTLREGDLVIEFRDAIDGLVFDQMDPEHPEYHGIAELSRVDFIVELQQVFLFVELKDLQNPNARPEGLAKFHTRLSDGTLASQFAAKFIDSFLYRWAEDKLNKPVHYLCLIETNDVGLLPSLTDEITKLIPPMGKKVSRWNRKLVESCLVLNLTTWNDSFPNWPVKRLQQMTTAGGTTP